MSPNFLSDSFVFSVSHPAQVYNVGDVVLVHHAQYGKMIKRISVIQTNKTHYLHQKIESRRTRKKHIQYLLLSGDNTHSVTTLQMGEVSPVDIIGKVVYQVKSSECKEHN